MRSSASPLCLIFVPRFELEYSSISFLLFPLLFLSYVLPFFLAQCRIAYVFILRLQVCCNRRLDLYAVSKFVHRTHLLSPSLEILQQEQSEHVCILNYPSISKFAFCWLYFINSFCKISFFCFLGFGLYNIGIVAACCVD